MKLQINSTKFLNTETDIKHKDIVTLSNEGQWNQSKKFLKEDGTPSNQFDINILLANEEERLVTLSYTNLKLIMSAWGDETAEWVGKKLRAWKTKSEKAKKGFVFVFVPVDWDRDDTGEWIIPKEIKKTSDDSEMPALD